MPTQSEINEMDLGEAVDKFMQQENNSRVEGRRGVESLCILARGLGYKDPQYWGQLTNKACVGDLIAMLEDNSGMIEAMIEWVGCRRQGEWLESLKEQLHVIDEDDGQPDEAQEWGSFDADC